MVLSQVTWLFLLVSANPETIFDCIGRSQCSGNKFTCDSNHDCTITCSGPNACDGSTFICPPSANQCNIICTQSSQDDSVFGCAYFTVDASQSIGGSLTITATNKTKIMEGATIKCPPNGSCNINCNADNGCHSTKIISHSDTTKLSIIASGNQVLKNSNITCPKNINYDYCSIKLLHNYTNMLSCANIYAQNSFNDIYIQCESDNCYESNCHPIIHCDNNYLNSCDMTLIDNSINQWECNNISINDCSITLYPTETPTIIPSLNVIRNTVRDGKVNDMIISTTINKINFENNNQKYNATLSFLISHIVYVLIIIGILFCCLCVILILTCYYLQIHIKQSKSISSEIKMEKIRTKSEISLNDMFYYNQYNMNFDTSKHIPLPTNINNNTLNEIDKYSSDESVNENELNTNEYQQINANKLANILMNSNLQLKNIPSMSNTLQLEIGNNVNIENNNIKLDKSNKVKEFELNELSECSERTNEEGKVKNMYIFSEDDNQSAEEMYDRKHKSTLGGIDEDYDEENQLNLHNNNNNSDGNIDEQILNVPLPKSPNLNVENTNINVNILRETENVNNLNIMTTFDKITNEPYPSLPPTLVQENRTIAN